jgi:hypothetical protein
MDHEGRRRNWRVNWDRLVLVAVLALQATIAIALIVAAIAVLTR